MARLYSIATGNASASGTWGTIDSTSYNDSESTTTALTTSYTTSSTFTPGAITISHIGVKLSVRTGTTGTITVALDQGGSDVSGTVVSINTADLPVAATADLNGGWHFFKLASPVTLLAATAYGVKARTSSSSQISLFSTATTNWARALVTTTTAAPAAGDDLIVAGEYTGAGTSNTFTVTWDITATTDFGSTPTAANSLLTPGLAICNKGTVKSGVAAATNYNMKISNSIIVYSGGTFNVGEVGTEIPRDSSFTLLFDCGTNVDYGLVHRNLSTYSYEGLSRTSGKNIVQCLLNTDEAANSTSLGVDTDTGWLDNDVIAVGSTTRTATQCESGTLNGNASASTLNVDGFAGTAGGLLNAHGGTSPVQAEVILLSRNIVIQGASASLQGYVSFAATSTGTIRWTRFTWLGSNTTAKRGVDIAVTTGSITTNYCAFDNFGVAGSRVGITSTSGSGISMSNSVSYNIANEHLIFAAANSGTWTIATWTALLNVTANTRIIEFNDVGGTASDLIAVGATQFGIYLNESNSIGTFTNLTAHSCANDNVNFGNGMGYISSITSWRSTTNGMNFSTPTSANYSLEIGTVNLFGNTTNNIRATAGSHSILGGTISGDSTFATTNGVSNQGNACSVILRFNNTTFGVASGIRTAHTNDINFTSSTINQIYLNNCTLASGTEVASSSSFSPVSFVASQKHDQTAGLHKIWRRYGIMTINTVTTQAGGYSLQMTPNNASFKLESMGPCGGFRCAVSNGQTVTVSCYVYEDGSYNGNRARLIVKRNDAMGISSDTVLDTATAASDGAWEQLSGTTASVTDDGVLEFVVDCDGTAGNLYVDTWAVS